MALTLKVPGIGESIQEATVGVWKKAEGEFVNFMLQEIPPAPVGAAEIRAWNTGSRAAAAG